MWVVCEELRSLQPHLPLLCITSSLHVPIPSFSPLTLAGCAARWQLITLSSWSSIKHPLGFTLPSVKTARPRTHNQSLTSPGTWPQPLR